jgi:hypothetical protein
VTGKGKFISTLLVIDTFFASFAAGFNSRTVLVEDPTLPPIVKPKESEKKKESVKANPKVEKSDKSGKSARASSHHDAKSHSSKHSHSKTK